MSKTNTAQLVFDPVLNKTGKNKQLRQGLSGVLQVGTSLWVANDETLSLERLSLQAPNGTGPIRFGNHKQFLLGDFLSLPVRPSKEYMERGKVVEADIEGLDYSDGYLWLVGSHSLKRKKPDRDSDEKENLQKLAQVSSDGNRYLLARIPLVLENGNYTLLPEAVVNGQKHTAAQLPCNEKSSALSNALKGDEHLGVFLNIPGKDNGLDIEGLAVRGNKAFIGLRGPVLRGWAVVMELEWNEVNRGRKPELTLQKLKKHFLQLDGLGVRDICFQGDDLLILAGPTMDLDGPVIIYRWRGGLMATKKDLVFRDELEKVIEIPFGQGDDHAEGMTLFSKNGDEHKDSLLVVYDACAKNRMVGESSLTSDIFTV